MASRLAWGLDPGALALLEAPTDSALLWAMTCDLLARGKPPEAALAEVVARAVEAGGGRLSILLERRAPDHRHRLGNEPMLAPLPGGLWSHPSRMTTTRPGWTFPTAPCSSPIAAGATCQPTLVSRTASAGSACTASRPANVAGLAHCVHTVTCTLEKSM